MFLIDDNSDEETQKIIETYLGDKRIRYYRSEIDSISERAEKIRYAALINEALKKIQGEYVSYATDDNVYRPHRLEKMVDYLDRHPEVNIVYSSSKIIDVDSGIDESQQDKYRKAQSVTWLAPCRIDHCSIMHRAGILPVIYEKWGSYWDEDPQYYFIGDARFFWRLNHFWPFYPIQEVLDDNYMTEISLHKLRTAKEKDLLIQRLPSQKYCRDLIESLRSLREGK